VSRTRSEQAAGWSYRPQLDGLRALAIVAVIGFHYFPGVFRGGHLGVQLFFVLSGYLITGLLIAEHSRTDRIDLRAFWIRRGLRLYPALFVAVLGTLLFAAVLGHPGLRERAVPLSAGAALLYVNDFAALAGNFNGYLDPTWSLGVEEQFYIVWPLVLMGMLVLPAMARTRDRVGLGRLVVILAGCFAIANAVIFFAASHFLQHRNFGFRWDYFTPIGNATALLAGAAVALAPPRPSRLLSWLAAAGGALIVAFFFVGPALHGNGMWYGLQVLFVVAAACVIAHQAARRFRPLAAEPVVWLGRRSYGVYLWHQAILVAVAAVLTQATPLELALIGIPCSILVAALSYRFVEQPCLRLKARYARVPQIAAKRDEPHAAVPGETDLAFPSPTSYRHGWRRVLGGGRDLAAPHQKGAE
jgi:peptidoglycan/LPS O-acetylase OafA/YrhL